MKNNKQVISKERPLVSINTRYNKYDVNILNIILFLYPFEFFDAIHNGVLGELSPFRVIILPLCLVYLYQYGSLIFSKSNQDIIVAFLFFVFSFISTISSGTISSAISVLGNAFQFFMAYIFFIRIGINKSSLFVITTWELFQIPIFLQAIINGDIGMTMRFHGLYFDPNYLCSFVLGSIGAAFYLYQNDNAKWLRLYCLGIMFLGLIMMFLSFSRGGLIALFAVIAIYLFAIHKKILICIAIIAIPVISTMVLRAQYLTWADGANNIYDAFLYRTITLSEDADELTSHRSELIEIFYRNIDSFIIMGTDLEDYIEKYNHGTYPHNGFIEIMIQSGVIVGLLYIFRLLKCIVKEIFMTSNFRGVPCELIIGLGILIPLTFLSYTSKIAWLCMGLLFALASKKVFKTHL